MTKVLIEVFAHSDVDYDNDLSNVEVISVTGENVSLASIRALSHDRVWQGRLRQLNRTYFCMVEISESAGDFHFDVLGVIESPYSEYDWGVLSKYASVFSPDDSLSIDDTPF